MYCAFDVVVASVVNRSAPAPAGAVASVAKLTAPPGRVSSVDQPWVLVGVTTMVVAAAATPIATVATSATSAVELNRNFFIWAISFIDFSRDQRAVPRVPTRVGGKTPRTDHGYEDPPWQPRICAGLTTASVQ